MKICFVQKQAYPYFGVMALSDFLKQNYFETDVLITNLEADLVAKLREVQPNLIGISLLSLEHEWLKEVSCQIKKDFPDIPIMVGGVHAILYPNEIMQIPYVDYVCTGEGEQTLLKFCNELQKRNFEEIERIPGIGFRRGAQLIMNERPYLWNDLDDFFDDRKIYYLRYPMLRDDEQKVFSASRGCPFKCAFCFNEHISDLFKDKGKYVRMKSAKHFVDEIHSVKKSFGVKAIAFADDLFTANCGWLQEFIPQYKKEIGLPFMCSTRANLMNEETAALLKQGGCHTVTFGVETGNEKIRFEVLGKTVTNEHIIKCAELLKKNGIRVQTSNMFCLPGETVEDAFSTVEMNIKIKADFVMCTLFMPFPGTRLAKYCIQKRNLDPEFGLSNLPQSFFKHSVLKMPGKEKIENVQKIAYWLVRFPVFLPFAKWMILKFNFRKLYEFLNLMGIFFRYKEERKISFLNALKIFWRMRKSY